MGGFHDFTAFLFRIAYLMQALVWINIFASFFVRFVFFNYKQHETPKVVCFSSFVKTYLMFHKKNLTNFCTLFNESRKYFTLLLDELHYFVIELSFAGSSQLFASTNRRSKNTWFNPWRQTVLLSDWSAGCGLHNCNALYRWRMCVSYRCKQNVLVADSCFNYRYFKVEESRLQVEYCFCQLQTKLLKQLKDNVKWWPLFMLVLNRNLQPCCRLKDN